MEMNEERKHQQFVENEIYLLKATICRMTRRMSRMENFVKELYLATQGQNIGKELGTQKRSTLSHTEPPDMNCNLETANEDCQEETPFKSCNNETNEVITFFVGNNQLINAVSNITGEIGHVILNPEHLSDESDGFLNLQEFSSVLKPVPEIEVSNELAASESTTQQSHTTVVAVSTLDSRKTKSGIQYQCPVPTCLKEFKGRWAKRNLGRHMEIHSGVKKYVCKICSKAFAQFAVLRNHTVRIHHRVKKFSCEFCDKKFLSLPDQRNHERLLHTREKVLFCQKCGEGFIHRNYMRRHKCIMEENAQYVCYHCGKTYEYRDYLQNHIRRIHTDPRKEEDIIKNFQCEICLTGFLHRSSWQRHMQRLHPVSTDNLSKRIIPIDTSNVIIPSNLISLSNSIRPSNSNGLSSSINTSQTCVPSKPVNPTISSNIETTKVISDY